MGTMNTQTLGNGVTDTFAYIDVLIIGRMTQKHHNKNLRHFEVVAEKYNITLKENKCEYCLPEVEYLGYLISKGTPRPNTERLQPLKFILAYRLRLSQKNPCTPFFYFQWTSSYFNRIIPIFTITTFPHGSVAYQCLHHLKEDNIWGVSVITPNENVPMGKKK